jgi:undecaprenyl-diphosphatase
VARGSETFDRVGVRSLGGPTSFLVTLLAGVLATYALVAHWVVEGGWVVELDLDVARWVARSMPTWAEWVARPFTWLGGYVGMPLIVVVTAVWLVRRGERSAAVLLVVVALGTHALVLASKEGYARQRPDVGSAIDLPSSFSFPSGHAANGVAVFGLLGLIVAARMRPGREQWAVVAAGFALGCLVGASRVVLDVHFVSDVVAGTCLGIAWLTVCLLVARLRGR